MAVNCLGDRMWFEILLDKKACRVNPHWARQLWRWNLHAIARMVDRDILPAEVVKTVLYGAWFPNYDREGWRVTGDAILVVVRRHMLDTPAVAPDGVLHLYGYNLVTAWRLGDAEQWDLVWNMCLDDILRKWGVF